MNPVNREKLIQINHNRNLNDGDMQKRLWKIRITAHKLMRKENEKRVAILTEELHRLVILSKDKKKINGTGMLDKPLAVQAKKAILEKAKSGNSL